LDWREAYCSGILVCTEVDESLASERQALDRSDEQGRAAHGVHGIDVSAMVHDQQLDDLGALDVLGLETSRDRCGACTVERSHGRGGGRVDRGSASQQDRDGRERRSPSCTVQWRDVEGIGDVGIVAVVCEELESQVAAASIGGLVQHRVAGPSRRGGWRGRMCG